MEKSKSPNHFVRRQELGVRRLFSPPSSRLTLLASRLTVTGLLVFTCGCASMRIQQTMEPDGYAYITAEEFADELDNGKGSFVLLDVRTPREYARGHLWGAVLIPSNEILTKYGELGCKCHEVVVYDSGKGQRSAFACKALADLGFQRVKNLAGGIKAWRKAGQNLVK